MRIWRASAWLPALPSRSYGLTRGGSGGLEGRTARGVALARQFCPKFPVILTVFLAIGAWRISRSQWARRLRHRNFGRPPSCVSTKQELAEPDDAAGGGKRVGSGQGEGSMPSRTGWTRLAQRCPANRTHLIRWNGRSSWRDRLVPGARCSARLGDDPGIPLTPGCSQ